MRLIKLRKIGLMSLVVQESLIRTQSQHRISQILPHNFHHPITTLLMMIMKRKCIEEDQGFGECGERRKEGSFHFYFASYILFFFEYSKIIRIQKQELYFSFKSILFFCLSFLNFFVSFHFQYFICVFVS